MEDKQEYGGSVVVTSVALEAPQASYHPGYCTGAIDEQHSPALLQTL
jgi:hypothetical protein